MDEVYSQHINNKAKYSPTKLSFKQAVIYRQSEFPRERVYQIFSPNKALNYTNHEQAFRIDGIVQKENLMISNLPIEERAKMQKYNIYCTKPQYMTMMDAPKFVFDVYHFNYIKDTKRDGQKVFSKTFYYMVAPTLYESEEATLPVLYRLGISRDLTEESHFSFSLYAVAGGYEDGFYFLGRLDNDISQKTHCKKEKKCKSAIEGAPVCPNISSVHKVPFPHFHRPKLNDEDVPTEARDLREYSEPFYLEELCGADFDKCLTAFLNSFNISPTIYLAETNCKVVEVIKFTKAHHLLDQIKTYSASEMEKSFYHTSSQTRNPIQFSAHDFLKYSYCVDFGQKKVYTPIKEQKCGTPYLRI